MPAPRDRKPAGTLTPGDRVLDPATGKTAVVADAPPIRYAKKPGVVNWLLRMDDGRAVTITMKDTDPVTVVV